MVSKMPCIAIAAAVLSGFAASENLGAACTGTVIAYQASGSFGSNLVSGKDNFKLAGEPFSINLYACEAKIPSKTGSDYSVYSQIELTGTVTSALETQPYNIRPTGVTFILMQPPTGTDSVQMEGVVPVLGSQVYIHGSIALPAGTLTSTHIAPFSSVAIVTSKSGFSYSYPAWKPSTQYSVGQKILDPFGNEQQVTTAGTSGTTTPAWSNIIGGTTTDNTVLWTCEGPYVPTVLSVIGNASGTIYTGAAAQNSPLLHTNAMRVITAHADGSQLVQPMQAARVDPGASSDKVMLQFYASGVRDAAEVHMQIAGHEVPVLYSGAAGHFPGLDEVTVEVPRSMAGMGDVDVVLTADGQAANPVRIHIQ